MSAWRWRKLGLIWNASGDRWWAMRGAMVPTPIMRPNGLVRVYFSSCDCNNVGRVGYLEVDPADPTKVVYVSPNPALDIGRPGTFDDNGVLACSLTTAPDGRLYLYYAGFELSYHIRYRLLAGLAISEDGGETFQRVQATPILERSSTELYFRGGPFVIWENNRFRMWYVAGGDWLALNGKMMPVYELRYAESGDGVVWPAAGRTCLPIQHDDEHGFGRPYVIPEEAGYRMFYSVRRKSFQAYRLGMARSVDGRIWTREDERIGLDVSDEGWDSQAVSYAAPIWLGGKLYMFYNGNSMGESGIGLTMLET